jgi:CHAT domain-containing protein
MADVKSLGGLGGEIFIHADALIMRDGCYISTSTESSGNAGSIHLDVGNLELFSGASINSKTENKRGGNAGSIIINASDFITLIGEETRISTSSHSIGKRGNISITTHKISLVGVSQKLYQLLIHPVQKDLIAANIHTLLVAPDGLLRLIPFASLHDTKNFLIEKYAVVTIPGIKLTDTAELDHKKKMETLVVGLSDAVQKFSALPSVKEELKDIKKINNTNKMYMNQTFTIPNVQNEFKHNDYAIVHFATHGVFGGTGKHSFLGTYDSQLDMDALEDLTGDTQ